MTDHAEREEAARDALVNASFYDHTLGMVCVPAPEIDRYRAAVLASARERVEALHETFVREALSDDAAADLLRQLVNAGRNQMPLPTAIVYWKPFERHNAALDAAARAITEAT